MSKRKVDNDVVFEDYFPSMVEKLGAEGFVEELCKGFELLMDCEKGLITLESLKNKCAVVGLKDEEEVRCMLREGDLDGDGCLNLMEFCVLMLRLSPHLLYSLT